MFNLLSPTYAIDVAEPFLIWGTVAIVASLIVAGFIIFFLKREFFSKYLKTASICFVFYALILGATALTLEILKKYNSAYLEDNYVNTEIISYVLIPLLASVGIFLIAGIILFVISKKRPNILKKTLWITGIVCAVAIIATITLILIFFLNNYKESEYYVEYGKLNSLALYISAGALVLSALIAIFIIGRNDKKEFDTRCITLAGICVALSFALSYIKLFRMPQGGSITLASMLPIMLFSYIYGVKKGVLTCFVYGVLQAVQDPFIVHPAQFLLDYPVAYMLVGFAGAFNIKRLKNLPQLKFVLGAALGGALRFTSHILSGVFAFGAYALDAGATNFLAYSLVYNSYVLFDVLIVIALGAFIFSSKSFVRQVEMLNPEN